MNRKSVIFVSIIIAVLYLPLATWGVTKHKEMSHDKITYIEHSNSSWNKAGRIVGDLKNPPKNLTIEFYSVSRGKIIYNYKSPGQLYVYMSKFLPPGTYKVTFKAPEYMPYTVESVKVRAGADCFINIRFGRKVFVNR